MICGFGLAWKWKANGTINLHYPNSPQSPIRVMKIETIPDSSHHYGHWQPENHYQPLSTSVLISNPKNGGDFLKAGDDGLEIETDVN